MRKLVLLILSIVFIRCSMSDDYKKITMDDYHDKMKGAWVGQMAGVGWGLPTEFHYTDQIIPAEEIPEWQDEMINQHDNDDIYVEMTFLNSMDKHGLNVTSRQAGVDFANSGYLLWAANNVGRENLRNGIAPPSSGHPEFNHRCNAIDYQIEADYSGIIAPGMPQVPVEMGEKFGRLMNYGDGLYGGQFVGALYSAAFFIDDIEEIIKAGLAAIPPESYYAACIGDVINWYHQYPDNWQKTWQLIEDKYHKGIKYQQFAIQKGTFIPIDAKLNGAYIVLGLLYGNGDMDSTIIISMRAGKDSDCNPSNAAGVLGAVIGFEKLDDKFKRALDYEKEFSFSNYNFNNLIVLCERFARELVVNRGGRIENEDGKNVFYIKRTVPQPSEFTPCYQPAPHPDDFWYTKEDLEKIEAYAAADFDSIVKLLDFNMKVYHCGKSVLPELITWNNVQDVLVTVPMNEKRGTRIELNEKQVIPEGKKAWFTFKAGHDSGQNWILRLTYGENQIDRLVSSLNSRNGWLDVKLELNAEKNNHKIVIDAIPSKDQLSKNYWSDFKINIK